MPDSAEVLKSVARTAGRAVGIVQGVADRAVQAAKTKRSVAAPIRSRAGAKTSAPKTPASTSTPVQAVVSKTKSGPKRAAAKRAAPRKKQSGGRPKRPRGST